MRFIQIYVQPRATTVLIHDCRQFACFARNPSYRRVLLFLVTATMAFHGVPNIVRGAEILGATQVGSSHFYQVGNYDLATGTPINASLVSGFSDPISAIAVSGSHLYVSTYAAIGTIGEYDATTGAAINASLISGLNYPNAIAVAGSSLFAYPGTGRTLFQYDANTGAQISGIYLVGAGGVDAGGNLPRGIAVSGNTLFAINAYDRTVGEYDITTGANLKVIPTGLTNPYSVVVSGSNLYVSDAVATGKVWEYNTITDTVVNSALITGLSNPFELRMYGSDLFVPQPSGIREYDATTGALINVIPLIAGSIAVVPEPSALLLAALGIAGFAAWGWRRRTPLQVTARLLFLTVASITALSAIPPATYGGEIFVTNRSLGTIGEYDATTGATINASLVSGLINPTRITLSGGNLFVANLGAGSGQGSIGEYNAVTGATVNASLVSGFVPYGIAVSGGNLFVTNLSAGTIAEYNAITGAPINTALVSGLNSPESILASGGNLFVVNAGTSANSFTDGSIGEYNASTGAVVNTSLVSGLVNPSGLAISAGNLFVTSLSSFTNSIGEYNATTGAVVNASLVTGFNDAFSIAAFGGNLFAPRGTVGTVGEYNATTGATVNASLVSGLTTPIGVAVVPEPTSFVLAAFGLAGLAAWHWRRRKH